MATHVIEYRVSSSLAAGRFRRAGRIEFRPNDEKQAAAEARRLMGEPEPGLRRTVCEILFTPRNTFAFTWVDESCDFAAPAPN